MTHKQGAFLYRLTLLKFWEPEQRPAATVLEASETIDAIMAYKKSKSGSDFDKAVGLVRRWFPDYDGASLKKSHFFGHKKRTSAPDGGGSPENLPGFDKAGQDDQGAGKAGQDDGQGEGKAAGQDDQGAADDSAGSDETPATGAAADVRALIAAGVRNIWLYGPAGTGKTTICKEVSSALGVPCTVLSCSAGTSPAEITGFKFPEPRPSAVSRAVGIAGVVVLDEITMLDPGVAAVANALLANGEIETSTGHVVRHADCVIIATANLTGTGSDRFYIGNNQLDASTLDRFSGGFVHVEYSAEYEARFNSDVVAFVQGLRRVIKSNGLRRIASTRAIIAGDKLKAAGFKDWKTRIVAEWSADELTALRAGGVL